MPSKGDFKKAAADTHLLRAGLKHENRTAYAGFLCFPDPIQGRFE